MPILPILGAGIGWLTSRGDRKRRDALEQMAMEQYGQVSEPILQDLQAQLVSTGQWDSLPSDFGNKNARDEAISRMMEVGTSGGMDPQSRLAMEEARQAAAAQEARGRASVRQEAQRRGMGGAGELLGQMSAQQAGAQSASMAGMRASADARERALQALMQGGGMAAQAEGQDFNRAARIAAERSALDRFNAEMGMRAQEGTNAVRQQRFADQLQRAGALSGAYQRRADQYGRNAAQNAAAWGGLGQSLENAAGQGMSMMMGAPPGTFGGGGGMGGMGGIGGMGGGGAPPAAAAVQPAQGAGTRAYGGYAPGPGKFTLEDAYNMGGYY